MDWNDFTSLSAEDMQAIWDFKTKDPFSILGIHPLETDKGCKSNCHKTIKNRFCKNNCIITKLSN